MRNRIAVFISVLICSIAWGQTHAPSRPLPPSQQSMPGMDMSGKSGHDMSNMKDMLGGDKEPTATPARTSCTPWKATWIWART